MKTVSILLLLFCCSGFLLAQTPGVSLPVSIDLGLGGGISIPSGTLADINKTGYNAGGKLRIKSLLPMAVVVSATYNHLPEKATDQSDAAWMVGAGLEYALPGVMVSPYLGADATLNIFNGQNGAPSRNRGGIGLGGGLLFALPGFGSFDADVKYQMLNVMGKDANEESLSQIAANISIMVTVL